MLDSTAREASPRFLELTLLDDLAVALERQAPDLAAHADRVERLAVATMSRLPATGGARIALVAIAARFHDAGKLAIDRQILDRNGPLTPEEYAHVRRHALIGANLIAAIAPGHPSVAVIRHHHEWWNGRGYPDGLRGLAIPLESRVIAAADAFDSMISRRPYREARPPADALAELVLCAGTQFDPEVVRSLATVLEDDAAAFHALGTVTS
jgi:HD-GYP domain-containing protein (c-di-GMP phosphodiesterase class II)